MSETEQEQIPPPPPTAPDAMMEGSSASLSSPLKKEKSKKEKDAGDKKKKKKSKRDKGGGDTLENSSSMYGMEESSASFQREENSMMVAGGGRVTAPPSDQASPSVLLYSTSPREKEERREVENGEEVAVVAQSEASHISNTREENSAPPLPTPVPPPPAVPAPRKQNDYQQQDGGVAPGTVMDDEEQAALPQQPPSQQEEVPPLAPTESQNAGGSCGGGAWDQEATMVRDGSVGVSGQTGEQKKCASAGFPINRYPIRNLKRAEVFFSITGWLLAFALWILTTVAVASIRENLRAANPRHHLLTATNAAVGSLTALSVVLVVMLGSQIYWMARVRDVVESATGTQVEVFGEVEEGGADGNTVGHSLRQRREDTSPTGGVEVLNSSVNAFLTPNAKLVHNEDGAGPATAGGSGSPTSSRIQELELRLKQKEAALTEMQSELARVRIDTLPKPPAKEEKKEENAKPTAYLAHLLPQNIANGEEKQERQRQIMERQTQYEWSITETMPPCVKELPEHYKTVNMGSHFLDMFGPNTDLAQMKIIAACDQLKEKFGCKDETPFDDYVEVYPGKVEGGKWVVDMPKVAKTWQTDKEFGRQRLGGMNPVYCRKLTQGLEGVKDRFPITDDMVEGLTEGKTLAELDAAGKLYYTDYSRFYEEVKGMDGLNGTVYVPFCLFWTNSCGDMMPLGIAMYQDPSRSPIFTPNNDHDGLWLLVKICVQQMECSNHICTEHLGGMHLWAEAFYVSCRRRLSDKHPINMLFWDSYWATMPVNTAARALLMSPEGRVPKDFVQGEKGMNHILKKSLNGDDVDFHRWTFPMDVADRGMEDCPNYYWRDDAGEGWRMWDKFLGKFLDSMYASDIDLVADTEVQDWAEEMSSLLKYKNLPITDGQFKTKDQFKFFLTTIMWHVTFKHMSIHMTQFEMMAFIPNCPNVVRKPLPMDKNATVTQVEIREQYLPDWDDMVAQIGFFAGVVYKPDEGYAIGQFSEDFVPKGVEGHAEHWELIKEFQADLRAQSAKVQERNKKLENAETGDVGYQYLDPEWMWRSIAV